MSDLSTPPAFPSSATIDAVLEFATAACPPFLMGHNCRTYRFGRMLVADDLDEEVAFVASMLHDIGLTDPHIGVTSFELVGAEVAARFLESRAWSPARIRLVEQAIIRHVELAPHDSPEMRVVQVGAVFDVVGLPLEALSTPTTRAVLAAHPRGSMTPDIRTVIIAEIARQPSGVFSQLETQVGLCELVSRNPLDNL